MRASVPLAASLRDLLQHSSRRVLTRAWQHDAWASAPTFGERTFTFKPQSSDVIVKMLAAPLNQSDLDKVNGLIPSSSSPSSASPFIVGKHGAGLVIAKGAGCTHLNVGDTVTVTSTLSDPSLGTWATYLVAPESDWDRVPGDVPPEYASVMHSMAAAHVMLESAGLSPGDTVIQNCGTGLVGQCVAAFAARKGVNCISVIREKHLQDHVERLKHQGTPSTVVISENYLRTENYTRLTSDLPAPKLAINGAGGDSGSELVRVLGEGGTMVTYSGQSGAPMTVGNDAFLNNDVTLKGFSLAKWAKATPKHFREQLYASFGDLITKKQLPLFLERHSLTNLAEAKERADNPDRDRKVILRMHGHPRTWDVAGDKHYVREFLERTIEEDYRHNFGKDFIGDQPMMPPAGSMPQE